jgi:DNA-binding transcriptional ArsR family regulator
MWELVLSTRALRDPSAAPLHMPWARQTRERVRGMDLLPLFALVPPGGYLPDFITPPPESPLAGFEDELAAVRAAPDERVRFEVGVRVEEGMDAKLAAPFLRTPRRAVERLADALAAYWQVALAPHWPRVRALLEADVLHRARRLTEAGPSAVLADLHPDVRWRAEGLEVAVAYTTTVALAGRGIVLMPTAFAARASAITSSYWQPTVMYPARGVGLLWEPGAPAASEALSRVLGRGRAAVLLALDAPRTTGEVARRLEITAGGASQHLTALRAAGLVTAARHGRSVLYARSPLADQLAG